MILLNSCGFHGQGADPTSAQRELDHGRVSDYTLGRLKERLSTVATIKPVNILLCHHHPQQHMELNLGEYDVMAQGQLLLELLGSGTYGEWLVIHGHKHHPKLAYASGGSIAPVVFSAGSLSAELYRDLGTRARNQFYILDFRLEDIDRFGLCGTFRAWDWASNLGWIPAGTESGLPARGGFGFRGNPRILAREIRDSQPPTARSWSEAASVHPTLDYLLPSDLQLLVRELGALSVPVTLGANGLPLELGAA